MEQVPERIPGIIGLNTSYSVPEVRGKLYIVEKLHIPCDQ